MNKSPYIRTLAISDIHGCYKEFDDLLKKVDYNPAEDELILLGDYCDRGFKTKEVIDLIIHLHEEWNVVCLRGNHDQMFIDALNDNDDQTFLYNGGIHTIESYCGHDWFSENDGFNYEQYQEAKKFIKNNYKNHIDFLKSLPVYHESEDHIFVHAGINPMYEDWKKQPWDDFIWIRDIFLNNKTTTDKTIIFGHTPTLNMQKSADVWFSEGKIGIDGGCCFGYQMNCLEITESGYRTFSVKREGERN